MTDDKLIVLEFQNTPRHFANHFIFQVFDKLEFPFA